MTQLISFPFRLMPNGSVATREDGDPDLYSEELAVMMKTVPGERELVPLFGLNDPTFQGFDVQDLVDAVELFGPPVTIAAVATNYVSDGVQDVTVSFDVSDVDVEGADEQDFTNA